MRANAVILATLAAAANKSFPTCQNYGYEDGQSCIAEEGNYGTDKPKYGYDVPKTYDSYKPAPATYDTYRPAPPTTYDTYKSHDAPKSYDSYGMLISSYDNKYDNKYDDTYDCKKHDDYKYQKHDEDHKYGSKSYLVPAAGNTGYDNKYDNKYDDKYDDKYDYKKHDNYKYQKDDGYKYERHDGDNKYDNKKYGYLIAAPG
ncbi:hypothetical protein BDK51DRAFT_33342, partial [Blyttiomyces helicus]